MKTSRFRVLAQSCCAVLLLVRFCNAADNQRGQNSSKNPNPYTPVETIDGVTRIYIDLRKAPDNLEPKAEPRRIQIDDRGKVQLVLRGLSPFDVCSLNNRTPTPTAETNVAESILGTIAKLGAFAPVGNFLGTSSQLLSLKENSIALTNISNSAGSCGAAKDPEYEKFKAVAENFKAAVSTLVTEVKTPTGDCDLKWADQIAKPEKFDKVTDQAQFACQIDQATRQLANYAGADFRGTQYNEFSLDSKEMQLVRHWYWTPPPSIEQTGELQALLDEMTTWAGDLHKRYDFPTPPTGGASDASAGFPPVIGTPVLVASPTALSFSYPKDRKAPDPQYVHVWGGGATVDFRVIKSTANWLAVDQNCITTRAGCQTLSSGALDFKLSVDPSKLTNEKDMAWVTFEGLGGAVGRSAIVSVSVKPSSLPDDCVFEMLQEVDRKVDRAKAIVSVLGDYNKALETAQSALKVNYMAVVKVWDDYQRRIDQGQIVPEQQDPTHKILRQTFDLGTDRKATISGVLSCVSDLDGKTPTTSNINYSILYQNVPRWTASAGLLGSFQQKRTYGIVNETKSGGASSSSMVEVTDRARAQAIPMAYVNWRFTSYHFHYRKDEPWYGKYGKNGEDKLVWTAHLSAGFGINPNNGANQPEFFTGIAIGLNRFVVHTGAHWGRRQFIGGGYFLNGPAPGSGAVPIEWAYRPAFSIGFSVRVAPY